MLDRLRGTIDGWRSSATSKFEEHGKIILVVGGGAFALLALANFGAAITLAVIILAVALAAGWVKIND